ncbi:hypothetical protein F3Y22_tig00110328pilonHSYRG00954 [Hibiscus syriacus]|uniref:Neprosin PEP catalytic domain-containing protein n=1 Tax=Hibiscus syriacus TaxID=106335 RepID=A0A6A3AZQ8_HIBSY|nr:hypothetical protein F3Y22_tig00110328pilonHSYRG00954 [Hibiscus syriacus]
MEVQSRRKLLRFLVMLLVFFFTEMAAPSTASRSRGNLSTQNLEVQARLKLLNKPAAKSIKSPDGDIIDCVKLAHQPAFGHPLFKNQKIQMTPNFHPERAFAESKVSSNTKPGSSRKITQMWHLYGRCPEGTIPMRRTKEDLLRASSVKAFGKKRHKTIPQPRSADPDLFSQSGHQHAIAYVDGDKYYGAKATINVWEPKIQQPNEFSLSQIWLLGGSFGEDLNSIEAGWHVSPDLYGDNHTRLFTYWTSDAYQATGCYNLLCSGFIQINNEIAMGANIYPISAVRKWLKMWQDPKDGNWWLQFGEVMNSEPDEQQTSTQMGNGHFPNEGFGKAGYFNNIQIVDGSNNLRVPKALPPLPSNPAAMM